MATNDIGKALDPQTTIELTLNGQKETIIVRPHTLGDLVEMINYIRNEKIKSFRDICKDEKKDVTYYNILKQMAAEQPTEEEVSIFEMSLNGMVFSLWRVLLKNEKFKNSSLDEIRKYANEIDMTEIMSLLSGTESGDGLPLEQTQPETPISGTL
jgi:hypothetical protein